MTESPCGVIEWVGVALISKRASRGVILGVAGSRYTSGPYTPVDPIRLLACVLNTYRLPLNSPKALDESICTLSLFCNKCHVRFLQ